MTPYGFGLLPARPALRDSFETFDLVSVAADDSLPALLAHPDVREAFPVAHTPADWRQVALAAPEAVYDVYVLSSMAPYALGAYHTSLALTPAAAARVAALVEPDADEATELAAHPRTLDITNLFLDDDPADHMLARRPNGAYESFDAADPGLSGDYVPPAGTPPPLDPAADDDEPPA